MLKTNDPSVDNLYRKSHSSLSWGLSFVSCSWTRFAQSLSISVFDAAAVEEISAAHFQPKFSKAFRKHSTSSYFVYATFFLPFPLSSSSSKGFNYCCRHWCISGRSFGSPDPVHGNNKMSSSTSETGTDLRGEDGGGRKTGGWRCCRGRNKVKNSQ